MAATNEAIVLGAQAGSILLTLLIARAALRANAIAGATPLRRFALGFGLLAASHAAALVLEYRSYRAGGLFMTGTFDAFDALFWAYYLLGIGGLAAVFASFGRHPFKWTPALVGTLLFAGPALEVATLLAFFFVVLHSGLNHIARPRAGTLQTAVGFFLLLVGRFLFFLDYDPLTPRNLLGEAPTLVGYLLLFLAIARPPRTP